jgi:predicted nucleic acid-binding protein
LIVARSYLIDSNILLRMVNPLMDQHHLCKEAAFGLHSAGCLLYYTLQNASEFWNVSTRPVDRNGHGLSTHQTSLAWGEIERWMTLLPDNAYVYDTWRRLVASHEVLGIQVHDAKLAAAMLAHDVPCILTLNTADFIRYPGIEAVHPAKV